jgi:hypothetical protein
MVKNGRNRSKFGKWFFINRSQIFIALPKFSVTHRNYEILSKSLVPNPDPADQNFCGPLLEFLDNLWGPRTE